MIRKYRGYEYVVFHRTNYGFDTYNAYVKLPSDHPLIPIVSKENGYYGKTDIAVHGGLTFGETISEKEISLNFYLYKEFTPGTWIGWDYAHSGDDWSTYFTLEQKQQMGMTKKWTAEEVKKECQDVIRQLIAQKVYN